MIISCTMKIFYSKNDPFCLEIGMISEFQDLSFLENVLGACTETHMARITLNEKHYHTATVWTLHPEEEL